MMANITFLSFLLFSMCHSIHVAVNTWLNCSFFTLICINNQQNARILHDSFPKNYQKKTEFLWYLPEKFTKFPNFTWFLPENARLLCNNCPKNIFPRILGGQVSPLPPVSSAYAAIVYPRKLRISAKSTVLRCTLAGYAAAHWRVYMYCI